MIHSRSEIRSGLESGLIWTNESGGLCSLDVPTLHVSIRVALVGPLLVVWSLHPLTAVAAVAPTDPRQRSLLIEESDVSHLVLQPVLVVPAEPITIARDCSRSSSNYNNETNRED